MLYVDKNEETMMIWKLKKKLVTLFRQYGSILSVLHPLFENQSFPGTTDNASGAVARLILAHPNAVPLDQVLPVFLNALPLKSDFAENEPVFESLFYLFRANNPFVSVVSISVLFLVLLLLEQKNLQKK